MYFFFFIFTLTTQIYTLSLHDALPISACAMHREENEERCGSGSLKASASCPCRWAIAASGMPRSPNGMGMRDRKSTRLNSSHVRTSYAVFCLKKKKKKAESTAAMGVLF